ncbi:MAG: hypothetical protein E7416_00640 [Ruminococcaceae bacterium]|nr:hypothetical protein [Oscillospiraceae bacterium]
MRENIKIISEKNVGGSVCFTNDGAVSVRLNLTLTEPLAETDVLKVMAVSSVSDAADIYCGIAETSGKDCNFTKTAESDCPEKFDTVKIIKKNVFTEETEDFAVVCFGSDNGEIPLDDELDRIRQQLEFLENDVTYKDYLSLAETIKSPIDRAAEALDTLRKLRMMSSKGDSKQCISRVEDAIRSGQGIEAFSVPGFEWYRLTGFKLKETATAIDHILSAPGAVATIGSYGHFIAGIKNKDNTVCIAIPVARQSPNPIPHVDDCCVYVPAPDAEFEYCTVCISFEEDGQYFTPLC